jgi:hypothetical protein
MQNNTPYLLIGVLFVPLVLALIFSGWIVALCVFVSSVVVARITRTKTPPARRMILIALVINQLVVIHSVYHFKRTVINGVDTVAFGVSEDDKPQPFVSIVLVQNPEWTEDKAASTFASLQANSSLVLTKEIVVPDSYEGDRTGPIPVSSSISDDSDLIVFVAPSVEAPMDWLSGLVREFLANDTRLVVPVIQQESGFQITGSMVSSKRGELVPIPANEFTPRSVPIIPYFTVLGVPRKTLAGIPNLSELLSEGRTMELSLRSWLCNSGIVYTRFTTVRISDPYEPDWKSLEGVDVDEKITGCAKTVEWFYSEFKDHDADDDVERFLIEQSGSCLSAGSDGKLSLTSSCDRLNQNQIFELRAHEIKSVGNGLCFDAASTMRPGKEPILYECMFGNRNQRFNIKDGRLMWGSFCVESHQDRGPTFEECVGFESTVSETQRWEKHVITENKS